MAGTQGIDKKTDRNGCKVVAEWTTAASSAADSSADVISSGWYSMKQLSVSVFNKSLSTTNRTVMRMIIAGNAESKDFRVLINDRLKVVPHYKLKK